MERIGLEWGEFEKIGIRAASGGLICHNQEQHGWVAGIRVNSAARALP